MTRRRAFTLAELLVAAMLTAVLAVLGLALLAETLDRWRQTSAHLARVADARLVLDRISDDLQAAILRADGNVWLAVSVLPDTGLSGQWRPAAVASHAKPGNADPRTLNLAEPSLVHARFGVAGVWLRLITMKPDTGADAGSLSAPVAVGWQIVRRNMTSSPGSEPRYLLFRSEVRRTATAAGSPGTFEAGYDLDPAATPATPYGFANGIAGDPGNLIRPPLGAAYADNVIDFGVRLYVHEGAGLRLIFPAQAAIRGGGPVSGRLAPAPPPSAETEHLARCAVPVAGDWYRHAFPDTADVMIRVLTGEGARILAAYESGRLSPPDGVTPGDYWWTLAEAHSEVFSERVAIPSRPP